MGGRGQRAKLDIRATIAPNGSGRMDESPWRDDETKVGQVRGESEYGLVMNDLERGAPGPAVDVELEGREDDVVRAKR